MPLARTPAFYIEVSRRDIRKLPGGGGGALCKTRRSRVRLYRVIPLSAIWRRTASRSGIAFADGVDSIFTTAGHVYLFIDELSNAVSPGCRRTSTRQRPVRSTLPKAQFDFFVSYLPCRLRLSKVLATGRSVRTLVGWEWRTGILAPAASGLKRRSSTPLPWPCLSF